MAERLTGSDVQKLLADHGIKLTRRQIAMDQHGDFSLNLTSRTAAALWRGGLRLTGGGA